MAGGTGLAVGSGAAFAAFLSHNEENLKCPAEENANCGKSPLTNAKKSCGKTDTRTNEVENNFKEYGAVFKGKPSALKRDLL
ncbi:MAG: hypothetical protein LBK62_11095 [Treponema sp.]|nr:hypothetical protein [Treponema sp.]